MNSPERVEVANEVTPKSYHGLCTQLLLALEISQVLCKSNIRYGRNVHKTSAKVNNKNLKKSGCLETSFPLSPAMVVSRCLTAGGQRNWRSAVGSLVGLMTASPQPQAASVAKSFVPQRRLLCELLWNPEEEPWPWIKHSGHSPFNRVPQERTKQNTETGFVWMKNSSLAEVALWLTSSCLRSWDPGKEKVILSLFFFNNSSSGCLKPGHGCLGVIIREYEDEWSERVLLVVCAPYTTHCKAQTQRLTLRWTQRLVKGFHG